MALWNDPRVLDGTMNNENMSLLMKRNPITAQDFHDAIAAVSRSTSTELCDRYRKWMVVHGSSCYLVAFSVVTSIKCYLS